MLPQNNILTNYTIPNLRHTSNINDYQANPNKTIEIELKQDSKTEQDERSLKPY